MIRSKFFSRFVVDLETDAEIDGPFDNGDLAMELLLFEEDDP